MGLQTLTVLLLAVLAAVFLLRKGLSSASGKGCASGCGSCSTKDCAVRKMNEASDTTDRTN